VRDINEIIKLIIQRKKQGKSPITLLAVCPNSSAVLEAAVKAAAINHSVMMFAATLNQVDFESSYTGWTPAEFVRKMNSYADKYQWTGALYPCLDHGGPWLKDLHMLANLTYAETMDKVKASIQACIDAGYKLLHIDPTVDRTLPAGQALPLELVVGRTVELIAHAEAYRKDKGLSQIAFEVGTEEVHGELVDLKRFEAFIHLLRDELNRNNLNHCWPCLLVAQVGTDLHTSTFKFEAARRLYSILSPLGSLAKGHYTDWVDTPEQYPVAGMGAANVGPEFTAQEFDALYELEEKEHEWVSQTKNCASGFMDTVRTVVVNSGRWKKWLLADELGLPFKAISPRRQTWLLKTGARYIWTNPEVVEARNVLYQNLARIGIDAHTLVLDAIAQRIERYLRAFNLQNSIETFG
jgi:D-tagatose-1,6-bisphosphate aldolase subunit GatZ/KbaZ